MRAVAAREGADLTHVDTWLFDLDNTLYPLETGLALEVSARITDFVAKLTGLPRDEAHVLQKRYLADHGLTLRGLMDHHGVDPDVFHATLHDVPLNCLSPDPALAEVLVRLPGRRLIFTNADDVHAQRVLDRLGLGGLFDDVFHIGSAVFAPKPSAAAFEAIIARHAIDPARTAFFEDAAHNLEPAAALGMTTILVGRGASVCEAAFIDHRAEDLVAFLATARLREGP
ncbi:MAG TPA: pyrimidine 5'-nucleotidase [Caulobacteraceae bacterium]|jgi:putative hydrolase of the HAD superfamily|nr:pyrimidine 5'-nucleotidase [Caulobacteraceae bacterium]